MCGVKDMVYRDRIVFGLDSNFKTKHVKFHFKMEFLRFLLLENCYVGDLNG